MADTKDKMADTKDKMADTKDRITEKKQQIVTAIRNWIHMDNLYESLHHQATNARAVRDKQEEEVLALLNELNLTNSVIQVSGATLQVEKRKGGCPPSTWPPLEQAILSWGARSNVSRTQAHDLIRYLHNRFSSTEREYLKKIT